MSYRTYPAIKVGRLAVDKKYAKSGVGSYLVKTMREYAFSISEQIGCRYVTVDAYPYACEFYKKLGFKVRAEEKHTVFRYFDILSNV